MVDNTCKPKAFNQHFQTLLETADKPSIQYKLISLKVLKTDKETASHLRHVGNKKEIPLGEFLRDIQKSFPNHQRSQVLKHSSDFSKSSMLIVQQINEDGMFVIMIVENMEFINTIKKDITLNIMNQLFRSFSHEFSTSLNCIQMLAQTILEEYQNNQQFVKQYINPILNACFVLNNVLQDIKDFSMILQKKFALTLQHTNLLEIIYWVKEAFSLQIEMKHVDFIIEDQTNFHEILTDPQRVKQCILNLVQNAQKYTESGYIKLRVVDEAYGEKRLVRVCVEDTGVGMCVEEQRRVTEFLDQNEFNPRENKESSFGIGLLISNQISLRLSGLSRQQGGGIHFESVIYYYYQ